MDQFGGPRIDPAKDVEVSPVQTMRLRQFGRLFMGCLSGGLPV